MSTNIAEGKRFVVSQHTRNCLVMVRKMHPVLFSPHPVELRVGQIQPVQSVHSVRIPRAAAERAPRFLATYLAGRGDPHIVPAQHGSGRVDPEPVAVLVDVVDNDQSRRSTSAAAKTLTLF